MTTKLMPLILCLLLLASCGEKQNADAQADLVAGHWGILDDVTEIHAKSMVYLIDRPESSVFKVCYQAGLAARWPQFEDELKIALAHWGRYIGRTLSLEVRDEVFGARPGDAYEALEYFKKNHCAGADLVVAEHDLKGPLAQVLQSYSYRTVGGKKEVVSLNKGLFIQKESDDFNWLTLSEALGPNAIEEIHDIMGARNQYYIKKDERDHLLFTTLVHEAGHIWGLCDQYELEGGRSNCDPHFGTEDLVDASIMAREPIFIALFLQDDDIEGIQGLARARGLKPLSFNVPKVAKSIPYKILTTKKNKYELVLKAAVNKNVAIRGTLELKIFDERGEYNTLTAEIKTNPSEVAHYEIIELRLDPKWQLTSALFISDQGEEILINL